MRRTLEPELLDALAADSPAARHSRRDLVIFNRVLGSDRWWARSLPPLRASLPPGHRGLEIGAGDGRLAAAYQLDAVDRAPMPIAWPTELTWHQRDILTFDGWDRYPVVCANLILHHFSPAELQHLGREWDRHAACIAAFEPWRDRCSPWLFALLCRLIRAHPVSRHDGRVSIAAGFRGEELPDALALSPARWHWSVQRSLLGSYRMIAQRRGVSPSP